MTERKRTNPARPQRCSKCGRELTPSREFTYGTVLADALGMKATLDSLEIGDDTSKIWGALGTLEVQVEQLTARACKRCALCEIERIEAIRIARKP